MMTQCLATRRQNMLGSLWMVASMVAFSVEDVFLKLASSSLPVSQVMIGFGALGMLVFALLGLTRGQSLVPPDLMHPSMILRFWFEVFGRLFFTLSLVLTALSSTVAILQATPLVVVAGAALIFGEPVSRGRWLAILVGLFWGHLDLAAGLIRFLGPFDPRRSGYAGACLP